MMNEKTLLITALICSIIGLALLFFISGSIPISEKTINQLNKNNLDEVVKVKGTVTNVINTSKVTIIEITQPQSTSIVLFNDKTKVGLSKGDYIEAIGKVAEYNGKMELIGQRVRVIG